MGGYLGGLGAGLLKELDLPAASCPLAAGVVPREAGARGPRQGAGDALGRHRVLQEGPAEAEVGSGCKAGVPGHSGQGQGLPPCDPASCSAHLSSTEEERHVPN